MSRKTLADLQAEADGKYAPYELELPSGSTLVLLPVLRLSDEKQDQVEQLYKRWGGGADEAEKAEGDNVDAALSSTRQTREAMHEMIRTVAQTRKPADELLKLKGDDMGFLLTLLNDYMSDSQLGEASTSES